MPAKERSGPLEGSACGVWHAVFLGCPSPFRSSRPGAFKRSAPFGLTSAMAAQLLEEDLVTCSICLGRYRDPVTLPCGHSFCGDCIQDSWRCCEKTCPECRQPFPEGATLRRNVTLSTLLQALPRVLHAQPPAMLPPEPRAGHCPRHGRPLEFFCRTEGLCVCSACTVHECRHHERALLDVERRGREVRDGAFRKAGPFSARGGGCRRRLRVPI